MKVLVIDIGGTHVKILGAGQKEPVKFDSGPDMTPEHLMAGARQLTQSWEYDAVSIGYPGVVMNGRIVREPHNLGAGWVDFDFDAAFGRPVRLINDAAMQALGAYDGGRMLFLGLGTGLGSALIVDTIVAPLELGHLPYKKSTYEMYAGLAGLERLGKKRWRREVEKIVGLFQAALLPEDIVLGGGNAAKLKELPPGCRVCTNADAFTGGLRLWTVPAPAKTGQPQAVHATSGDAVRPLGKRVRVQTKSSGAGLH